MGYVGMYNEPHFLDRVSSGMLVITQRKT